MARRYWLSSAVLPLAALGAGLLFSGTAEANTCEQNQDCEKGFVCAVVGASACPGQACPPDTKCDPLPPCEPQEFKECVPGPCESDSDCASDMVCLKSTSEMCSGSTPACAPNQECPPAPPPECETRVETQCAPKYMAPCTVDADCGDGFSCVEAEDCACSGSGGAPTPAPTPGTDPAPTPSSEPAPMPQPDCTCTPTGKMRCEMREITCTDAAQCPSGWTCEASATSVDECPPAREGEEQTCKPAPAPEKQCMPPYYDMPRVSDGTSSPGYGSPTSGSDSQAGAEPPKEAGGLGTSNSTESGSNESSGSCQVGHGAQNGALGAFLMLLGLVGLRRRRAP